jgi:hypothetical protein
MARKTMKAVRLEVGVVLVQGVRFGAQGLIFEGACKPAGLSQEQLQVMEDKLKAGWHEHLLEESAYQWAIADYLLGGGRGKYGEYGEAYKRVAEWVVRSPGTVGNWVQTREKFPPSRLRPVSFSHHMAVKSLRDDVADELLDKAVGENWSEARLEEEVQQVKERLGAKDDKREEGEIIAPAVPASPSSTSSYRVDFDPPLGPPQPGENQVVQKQTYQVLKEVRDEPINGPSNILEFTQRTSPPDTRASSPTERGGENGIRPPVLTSMNTIIDTLRTVLTDVTNPELKCDEEQWQAVENLVGELAAVVANRRSALSTSA